jgi:hypothetical protein
MGGSDTPTTPDLRASDAERDQAVSELRDEFVEGRLSHETFVQRMHTALGARNRGQLEGLFTDLPPRRAGFTARIRAALHLDHDSPPGERPDPDSQRRARPRPSPWPHPGYRDSPEPRAVQAPGAAKAPEPLVFPPGRGSRFTIGRTRDCDLCLSDLSVSRLHAELVRDGDGWLLNDLGSHNGTRLNGWLVRETVRVRPGDRLEFGAAAFILTGDPPAGTAAG